MDVPPKMHLRSANPFMPTDGRRNRRPAATGDTHPSDYWEKLCASADRNWLTVEAEAPGQKRKGVSGARDFECSDGKIYVAKPPLRSNIAEHIVGRIGKIIDAPVPNIALVNISQDLIDEEPSLENFQKGLTHGSEYIPGLRDSRVVDYTTEDENRVRFARLAVLYALTHTDDQQFLYCTSKPHLVYSHDHGYFFPGNRSWTLRQLNEHLAPAIDDNFLVDATLTQELLDGAVKELSKLTDKEIVNIAYTVPTRWGIDNEQRIGISKWLAARRDILTKDCLKD